MAICQSEISEYRSGTNGAMGELNPSSPVSSRALIVAAAVVALCGSLPAGAAAQEGSLAADRAALAALYDATDGPNWTDSTNWKTDAPLEQWHGVTMHQGRVWGVDLRDNALAGSIPSDVGSLTNLKILNLRDNELTGSIPAELGNLTNLERLELHRNGLTGPIPPSLGNLADLRLLYLNDNGLTGTIPSSLGRLSNLRHLTLWRNQLTGQIPGGLGDLANLERLALTSNELTGPIPDALGNLTNLQGLYLNRNELTGPIPAELGNLVNLEKLELNDNGLTGQIPAALGRLSNLKELRLSYNWGLSGPLPTGLEGHLEELDIFLTRTCAPTAWLDWLATIDFRGRPCGAGTDVTIDVAVVYTPAAREEAGGRAAIEAVIDLMVAETNQAYETSGVRQRLALVARSEVQYAEAGDPEDLWRLADPADGYMDEVHAMRDRTGADLVHLVSKRLENQWYGGRAERPGAFGYTCLDGGSYTFAHELGHNMGLRHDRYRDQYRGHGLFLDPAYGYVNQRAFEAGAPESSRWVTIMAIRTQCEDAGISCIEPMRFSNPRQTLGGDPLGVPFGAGAAGVTGPADAAAVLNNTGPAVALWRDRPPNRPPAAAATLSDQALTLPGTLDVDVSRAFADPDGDALTYAASSSAPQVVRVSAAGPRLTLTAVSGGEATVQVTAADPDGLSAAQSFAVAVTAATAGARFTDDPLRPGVTPVRAVHFMELRARIDLLREAAGLGRQRWTDPVLRAGVTPVRLVHLTELRSALEAAYRAAGRPVPRWTDAAPARGRTPIRAAHLTELRNAVVALE